MAQNQGQQPVTSIISDKLASALLDLALGLTNSLLPSLQLLRGLSVVMSSPASSEGEDCSLYFACSLPEGNDAPAIAALPVSAETGCTRIFPRVTLN